MIEIQCKPVSLLRRKLFARRCERKGDPEKCQHQVYRRRIRVSVDAKRDRKRVAKQNFGDTTAPAEARK